MTPDFDCGLIIRKKHYAKKVSRIKILSKKYLKRKNR